MAFKVKKVNIDLQLDLTEYIQGDDGVIDSERKNGEDINNWQRLCVKEADRIQKLQKDDDCSLEEVTNESHKSMIKQIDFFYEKGADYYNPLPVSVLANILEYLQGQINPVKKK